MKFLLIILSILVTSCSLVKTSKVAPDHYSREITNFFTESCQGLIQKINSSGQPKTQKEGIPLSQILNERKELEKKYSRLTESVDDFQSFAHKPVKGKAKLLQNPEEGYLAKIMMIRNAKQTIDLSYYIFKSDHSAQAILHELRLAIRRGVKVRILLDALGSISKFPFYRDLISLTALRGGFIRDLEGNLTKERAKAEAIIFNPLFTIKPHVLNWFNKIRNLFMPEDKQIPISSFSANRRSHDKILMVDAHSPTHSMAMIGGRNIANYYYGFGKDSAKTYEDVEVLIRDIPGQGKGKGLGDVLNDYYNKVYYFSANKNLQYFIMTIGQKMARKQFKKMRSGSKILLKEDQKIAKAIKEMENDDFLNKGFDEGLISVVNELQNVTRTKALLRPLGPHNKLNGDSLVSKLHSQMKQAEHTIDIISPYLWLTNKEISFLKKWVEKDPRRKVRLVSNSITTTDNIPAQAMVDSILGPKLVQEIKGTSIEKQIEVYAYGRLDDEALGGQRSYGKLHGKFSIIDGKAILLGTSNLDPRSRYLNTEIAIAFDDQSGNSRLATDLGQYTDSLIRNSSLWGSPEWQEIRNHKTNKIALLLQKFTAKVIHLFNLVPLI